jgi:putative ABC transport system substrate-binding protein
MMVSEELFWFTILSKDQSEETTMKRCTIGIIFTLALLLALLTADAQPPAKVPRIGVLWSGSPLSRPFPPSSPYEIFWQSLHDLGYRVDQNINLEYRYAAGEVERLPTLAAELVQLNVDVIVAMSTPAAQAAKQATATIPIVFAGVADPVGVGLVTSLARPGGNITGVSGLATELGELSEKLLEVLKDAVPSALRVGLLWNPSNPSHGPALQKFESTARSLKVQLYFRAVQSPEDFDMAFAALTKERVNALLVAGDPLFSIHRSRIVDLVKESRLPAIFHEREFVQAGGLMSYGPNSLEQLHRAAYYVNRILQGTRPQDLPVEQPMRFELMINFKAAQALGLTLPPSILILADEVIEVAGRTVPGPPEVTITPPAADLPPELATYSGTWEGAWGGILQSRLVVEKIDTESARAVYAWADHPQGRFKGGWIRVRAKVLPGGKLQWGKEVKFTFEMAHDRMSIEGEREEAGGYISIVIMRKVAP